MHSAPVIVGTNNRTDNKIETVYVGDVYGMLHAIDPETGNEKWAYIPRNLLGKLKNDRTDPQAIQDFAAVDASATVKDIFYDHDNNPDTPSVWRTILVCPEGLGGYYIFALDVTNPDDPLVLWEITDTDSSGGGMGHSRRAALNRVKWPIKNQQGEITSYIAKWIVFTASGYADIAEDHGGINIYAFDLITGDKLWHFSSEYTDSVNDIPGAVTLFDMNGDNFIDRIYVGDMNGRLWEINAVDGTNPNGKDGDQEIPLWNCGVGNPISVSPSIKAIHGNVLLIFGTGGTNWASDEKSYAVYAINAKVKKDEKTYAEGAAKLMWKLDLGIGEKCWSSPSIAAGQIYFATTFGAIESGNPGDNIAKAGQKTGNLYSLDMKTGNRIWTINDIGKTRGAVFVDRQHIYLSSIDNKIIQVGGEDFSAGRADNVVKTYWREL
jgi:Tfp pilus tip-associated adhesin PilY1